MNKYNVGDVVKLRDDLELRTYDGDFYCNYIMTTFKGQKATIASVSKTKPYYTIEEDYRAHYWTDEMIEGLWEECKEKQDKLKLIDVLNMIAKGELKEGTRVKIRGCVYVLRRQYCSDVMPDLFRGDEDGDEVVSLFEDYYLSGILNDEVELEPPCEHEWLDWETHRMGEGRIRRYRRCNKCGLEEVTEKCVPDVGNTIEPTKIEELEISDRYYTVQEIIGKLNEVIRKINKE